MLNHVLSFFMQNFPEFNNMAMAAVLILTRFIGFMLVAPVFYRKEIPNLIKIPIAFVLTITFIGILHPQGPPPDCPPLMISVILNFLFGILIGYIAALIFAVMSAAGDMVNMQMGLSSAVVFDPGSKEQTTVVGSLFTLLGTAIFIQIGGLHWMLLAFARGFDVFGIYGTALPLEKVVNMGYLVMLTGNVLFVGLQIASSVLVATMAQDIILGVISRTAPQVNVFQLSFLFKPVMGVAILLILLPLLFNIINDYFLSFARIF